MPLTPDELVRDVHASGVRLVLSVTGGGSGAIPALLTVPGASRSVLSAIVPYAELALVEWLGGKPDEFCSERTARQMAMAGLLRAVDYAPSDAVCSVGCTASLVSDRPKRGAHRAHLAWQSASTTATLSVELVKGRRSRAEEEAVIAHLILNQVAEACGVTGRLDVALERDEPLTVNQIVAPAEQQELLAGRTHLVAYGTARGDATPLAILPGAFRPVHEAHREMAKIAGELLGHQVAFEISIVNVDKPPLDYIEMAERLAQFSGDDGVWLTRAPNFSEKAELFPGATFVVGADTIARIGQVEYYGGHEAARDAAIERIGQRGCRFLVFARTVGGTLQTLSDLDLPPVLAAICQEVPAGVFRRDISSTELRAAQAD